MILANPGLVILDGVDPCDRRRFAGRRVAVPLESLSGHAAERVIDPVVDVLDLNASVRGLCSTESP